MRKLEWEEGREGKEERRIKERRTKERKEGRKKKGREREKTKEKV